MRRNNRKWGSIAIIALMVLSMMVTMLPLMSEKASASPSNYVYTENFDTDTVGQPPDEAWYDQQLETGAYEFNVSDYMNYSTPHSYLVNGDGTDLNSKWNWTDNSSIDYLQYRFYLNGTNYIPQIQTKILGGDSDTISLQMQFDGGNIEQFNGADYLTVCSYSTGEWNTLNITYNWTAHTLGFNLNGTDKGWYTMRITTVSACGSVIWGITNVASGDMFVDDVEIGSPTQIVSETGWTRVVVDSSLDGAHSIIICNIDDDDKTDLVVAGYQANWVGWYKQPADPVNDAWTKYTIDASLNDAHDISIGDIDEDGDIDVVAVGGAAEGPDSLNWYRCPADPTGLWDTKIIDDSVNIPDPRSCDLGEIDGANVSDIAVAANDQSGSGKNAVIFYLSPSDPYTDDWTRYVLDSSGTIRGSSVIISDIDKDGNPDIVFGGEYDGIEKTYIYFAPDDPTNVSNWTKKELVSGSRLASGGTYDLDGDTYTDIIVANSTATGNYTWLKNPASDITNMSNWTQHEIDTGITTPRNNVDVGDFDGDGNVDICACWQGGQYDANGKFVWYENSGDPTGTWTRHIVEETSPYIDWAHDIYAGDIDNDGSPDIAGVACSGDKVMWWENPYLAQMPSVSNPYPSDGATGISIPPSYFNITVNDPNGDIMNITWQTKENGNWVTFNTTTNINNGTYSVTNTSWVDSYNTKYWWRVLVNDGQGNWNNQTYSFTTQETSNNPPNKPSNPDPANNSENVSVYKILEWTGGDPDSGDTVTYDIYFGNTSSPSKVISNQSDTSYNPELEYNTTYYWKIVAWDNHGASNKGDLWNFKTGPQSALSELSDTLSALLIFLIIAFIVLAIPAILKKSLK